MPTCPKCGAYNPDSYEFCSRCGEMMSPVEMGAPVSKRYTADRPALRYLLIILQIIPCVLGLYLLFGTRLDVTGSYGFFSDTMSIMEILGQGWYPTSISASGFTIIFWISAILFVVGLAVPVFHIFGYVMTLGMAMGMSEMFVLGSDSVIIVGADVGGMEILAVLGLLMGIAAVFLWFAVVVRGPCASMPLKLRFAYVWTGRVGERERRSPREPVYDPDAVHVDPAVPEDGIHDAGAVCDIAGVVGALHDAETSVLDGCCDELGVLPADAVPASGDDRHRTGDARQVLRTDVRLGEHHADQRLVAVKEPREGHALNHRGAGVRPADEEPRRDIWVLHREQEGDYAAVAEPAYDRVLDPELADEVVEVVRHVGVVVLPVERRRALTLAARIHQIHRERLLQIVDGAVEDRMVLAVSVEHDQRRTLLPADLVVDGHAVGCYPHRKGVLPTGR